MRRLFLLFGVFLLGISEPLFSNSYLPHAEVEGDPSSIIAGCVNAVTGTYSESEVDIVIPGPEPLSLQRFYCSADWAEGTLCNGWTYNHAKNALLTRDGPNYLIIASEATGGAVNYSGLGKMRKGRTQQKTDYYSTPGQTMHSAMSF